MLSPIYPRVPYVHLPTFPSMYRFCTVLSPGGHRVPLTAGVRRKFWVCSKLSPCATVHDRSDNVCAVRSTTHRLMSPFSTVCTNGGERYPRTVTCERRFKCNFDFGSEATEKLQTVSKIKMKYKHNFIIKRSKGF